MSLYSYLSSSFTIKYILPISIFIGCFIANNLSAQEISSTVISSTGKSVTSSEVTLSYTVGESIATVKNSNEGFLIQGFEQPKIDTLSVSVFENDIEIPIKIYPNPTTGPVNIEIESQNNLGWNLAIYNIEGKTISTSQIHSGLNTINLTQYPTANYVLVISSKSDSKIISHIIEKIN